MADPNIESSAVVTKKDAFKSVVASWMGEDGSDGSTSDSDTTPVQTLTIKEERSKYDNRVGRLGLGASFTPASLSQGITSKQESRIKGILTKKRKRSPDSDDDEEEEEVQIAAGKAGKVRHANSLRKKKAPASDEDKEETDESRARFMGAQNKVKDDRNAPFFIDTIGKTIAEAQSGQLSKAQEKEKKKQKEKEKRKRRQNKDVAVAAAGISEKEAVESPPSRVLNVPAPQGNKETSSESAEKKSTMKENGTKDKGGETGASKKGGQDVETERKDAAKKVKSGPMSNWKICFSFQKHGECKLGETCQYSHEAGETKSNANGEQVRKKTKTRSKQKNLRKDSRHPDARPTYRAYSDETKKKLGLTH